MWAEHLGSSWISPVAVRSRRRLLGIMIMCAVSCFRMARSFGPPLLSAATVQPTRSLLSRKLYLFGKLQEFMLHGSAYSTRIDYNATLDYPGPVVGQWATDGIVPTQLRRDASDRRDGDLKCAAFAGGCFWGMELAYQRVSGVEYTLVGYTQGPEKFPTYDQVSAGNTGHTEAVLVAYDPVVVSYETLLDVFFDRVDPTVQYGQGKDYGRQYRTGIYYATKEQEEAVRARFQKESTQFPNRRLATECKPAQIFWPAEAYHQRYLERGGRFGNTQSAAKGATDEIRCYG